MRDRIGAEIHRRIRSAMGPDADPRTVSALEMTYFGALVHAGSGYVSYREIADRLTYVVGLILGRPSVTVPTSDVILDPYDYDFHEDPYPYYKRLRDEAPLYHNAELGFWALSRHHDVREGFRNSTTLSNATACPSTRLTRAARQQDDVVPRDGRPRPSAPAHVGLEGIHPATHPGAGVAGHARRPHLDTMLDMAAPVKPSTTSPNSQASCRWTSSPS